MTDGTSTGPKVRGHQLRDKYWIGLVICLVIQSENASAHTAGDLGSNPGLGKNLSLKLTLNILLNYSHIKINSPLQQFHLSEHYA